MKRPFAHTSLPASGSRIAPDVQYHATLPAARLAHSPFELAQTSLMVVYAIARAEPVRKKVTDVRDRGRHLGELLG